MKQLRSLRENRIPPQTSCFCANSGAVVLSVGPVNDSLIFHNPTNEPAMVTVSDEAVRPSVYQLFRPFLILMRLGGVFFMRRPPEATNLTPNLSSRDFAQNWRGKCSRTYCFVAFLGLCLYGGKFLYSFYYNLAQLKLSHETLGAIVNGLGDGLWFIQVFLTHLILLRACWSASGMTHLFASWERLQYEFDGGKGHSWERLQCKFDGGKGHSFSETFGRRVKTICGIAAVHCALSLIMFLGPVFIVAEEFSELRLSHFAGFSDSAAANIVEIFLTCTGGAYVVLIFTIPGYFFLLNGEALTVNFDHLTRDLERRLMMDGTWGGGMSLEWFRVQHSRLCGLLSAADHVFGPWIALTLTCSTIQIFCIIYGMYAGGATQTVTMLSTGYWLASYFVQMALTLYSGVMVHSAVKISHSFPPGQIVFPNVFFLQNTV